MAISKILLPLVATLISLASLSANGEDLLPRAAAQSAPDRSKETSHGQPSVTDSFRDFAIKHRFEDDGAYSFNSRSLSHGELQDEWERLQNVQRISTLRVNVANDKLDFWQNVYSRHLTYAIDKNSFPLDEYEQVQENMAQAAKDWELACPECEIKIEHLSKFDVTPSHDSVKFIVRKDVPAVGVLASSFFPSTPPNERFIQIGGDYFGQHDYSKTGILRHNIGHILGYRHGHLGRDGCYAEGQDYTSGAYDPQSVMHYLCGGGGTKEMRLSELDIRSHRLLYGTSSLEISIQGNAPIRTAARALSSIVKTHARTQLQTESFDLADPLSCDRYLNRLGLPLISGHSERWNPDRCHEFKSVFNRQTDGQHLLPIVKFEPDLQKKTIELELTEVQAEDGKFKLAIALDANVTITNSAFGLQKKVYFDVTWTAHRAKLYGTDQQITAAWRAVEGIAEPLIADGSIKDASALVQQSISSDINSGRILPRYSQTIANAASIDDICGAQQSVFSHQLASLGPDHVEMEEQKSEGGASFLDAKCHMPKLAADACGKCDCNLFDKYCELCPTDGNPPRHCAQSQLIVVDEKLDDKAIYEYKASANGANQCQWANWANDFHGTHMASLAAGRARLFGVSPAAAVRHVARAPEGDLHDRLRRSMDLWKPRQLKVFLFASQFCNVVPVLREKLAPGHTVELKYSCNLTTQKTTSLKRESVISSNPISKLIRDRSQYPWVIAIGEPQDAAGASLEFDNLSVATPMILADQPNVILVTSCTDCQSKEPQLWPQAYKGRDRLRAHIAVPSGIEIYPIIGGKQRQGFPGAADEHRLTAAYGTSQSAAVVAGVTAKLQSCYPGFYSVASSVKETLQISAKPVAESDEQYIAGGALDVEAVLKHPKFHYLIDNTGPHEVPVDPSYVGNNANKLSWCSSDIAFTGVDGKSYTTKSINIRRIKKISSGTWLIRYKLETGQVESLPRVVASQSEIFRMGDHLVGLNDVHDFMSFDELSSITRCQ